MLNLNYQDLSRVRVALRLYLEGEHIFNKETRDEWRALKKKFDDEAEKKLGGDGTYPTRDRSMTYEDLRMHAQELRIAYNIMRDRHEIEFQKLLDRYSR